MIQRFYNANNYYSFGSLQSGQSYQSSKSRYGFNGKEQDREIKGDGSSYDFGARMYNADYGRFFTLDPDIENYPYQSPFNCAEDNPINYIDIDGRGVKGQQNNIFTINGIYNSIKEPLLGMLNEAYINYQIYMPRAYQVDSKGNTPPLKDLWGNKVNINEKIRDAATNFLLTPLGKINNVERALINGVERDIKSASATKYFKHGKNIKIWNKEIIESTKSGNALFKPDIDLKKLDIEVYRTGTIVPNKNFLIKDMGKGKIIGATNGQETQFVKTYYNQEGELHSVPISKTDYDKFSNEVKNNGK